MTGLFSMYQDKRVKAGVGWGEGGVAESGGQGRGGWVGGLSCTTAISLHIQVYNRSHTDVLHIYKAKVHIKH